jgi:hypothetical protein
MSVRERGTRGRRNTMKASTKELAEGKFHNVKGTLKEVAGKLSMQPNREGPGEVGMGYKGALTHSKKEKR